MKNINYISKDEIDWRDQISEMIITDQKGRCWKFKFKSRTMDFWEIVECIEKQFYTSNSSKAKEVRE